VNLILLVTIIDLTNLLKISEGHIKCSVWVSVFIRHMTSGWSDLLYWPNGVK